MEEMKNEKDESSLSFFRKREQERAETGELQIG